ncbi:hypothetical protein GCM10010273_55630 [Streptomyces lavendulocolor]
MPGFRAASVCSAFRAASVWSHWRRSSLYPLNLGPTYVPWVRAHRLAQRFQVGDRDHAARWQPGLFPHCRR